MEGWAVEYNVKRTTKVQYQSGFLKFGSVGSDEKIYM
jgi:hypothetical protein